MFNDRMVIVMASPAKMDIHGIILMTCRPSLIIDPHVGSGGCTPKPI
jgi:hypothetical protein